MTNQAQRQAWPAARAISIAMALQGNRASERTNSAGVFSAGIRGQRYLPFTGQG